MLEKEIHFIKGIGPKKAEVIKNELGIETVEDLLYFGPRKYLDRSAFKAIKDTFANETVTVGGNVVDAVINGRNRKYLEVIIDDGTDTISGIFFNSLNYFKKIFTPGEFVLFSGNVEFYRQKQIVHPDFDFIDEDSRIKSINTGRVIPLYRSTEKLKKLGLDSRGFRRIIRSLIDSCIEFVNDPLNKSVLKKLSLMSLKEAIFSIHFPESLEAAESARRRLSFNELFFLQYYLAVSKKYTMEENLFSDERSINDTYYKDFIKSLPFDLTGDQQNAITEIETDLKNPFPMNRLLQGDVGSGKTLVSIAASLLAYGRGDQVAFMAPTEVLAVQHYDTLSQFIPSGINFALLKGNLSAKEKNAIYKDISEGNTDIIIGTHALIQEKVIFKKLGLIIIDEQHKFGVNQRAKLREKGKCTDLLIMTATPIPRSLSMTIYGDLDVSYIKEKPADRLPITTMSFPESKIRSVYNSIKKYISQGRQVYVVLPLIQESEKVDLKSAVQEYEKLKNDVFPERIVELLHGKMSSEEKETVMQKFKQGDTDILVSTTVIEVGVDVPNATIMVIEHAERFGLAQLHQLRGRVGRGKHQSFCALIYADNVSNESLERINTIVSLNDGFQISEQDLRQRGAGNIIGSRQHGYASGFEFADIVSDIDLIIEAKKEAEEIVSGIDNVHQKFDDLQKDLRLSPLLNGIRTKRVLSILS
ncbi:MAG: ATP-dependent DNA helicase RecG [Spirochaetes bacterium]|nr:ATP-dependent DNA helicase RecG [Spirochaetota bacterium]